MHNDPTRPPAAANAAPPKEEKEKKKRRLIIFLIFFIILFLISEGILLYRLGGIAQKSTGRAIDTIVLDPDQAQQVPLSLCGRVQYSSGAPAQGLAVELHSDPKQATTDQNGDFYFENIEYGSHTLTVTDKNGNKKVLADLNIQRDSAITDGKQIFTKGSDGTWYFKVPDETLNIEFNMQMNSDRTEMIVVEDSVSAMLTDSWVLTYYGSGKASEDGPVMTLHGSVMLSDGTIHLHTGGAILSDGVYIDQDGAVYRNGQKTDSSAVPDGYDLDSGALTVTTPDGSVINLKDAVTDLPDGTIVSGSENKATFPDGTIVDNANNSVTTPDGYVIASDGTVTDPDGNKVTGSTLPDGTVIGSDGSITTPDGSVVQRPEPDRGYIIDKGDAGSPSRPIDGPSAAGAPAQPASSAAAGSGSPNSSNTENNSKNNTGNANGSAAANSGTNGSSGAGGQNGSSGGDPQSGSSAGGNNGGSGASGGNSGSGPDNGSGAGGNSGGSGTGADKPPAGDSSGGNSGGSGSGNAGGSSSGGSSAGGSSGDGHSDYLGVVDKKTDLEWSQLTTIDLFRDAGNISPGSSSKYDFYIRNGVRGGVRFRMTIEEADHEAGAIPLEYRLRDSSGYIAGTADSKDGWLTASELEAVWVTLSERGSINYTLEWRWPYERGSTPEEIAKNDAADTALGNAAGSEHYIHVKIYAESN